MTGVPGVGEGVDAEVVGDGAFTGVGAGLGESVGFASAEDPLKIIGNNSVEARIATPTLNGVCLQPLRDLLVPDLPDLTLSSIRHRSLCT